MPKDTDADAPYLQKLKMRLEPRFAEQDKQDDDWFSLYQRDETVDMWRPNERRGETKLIPVRAGLAGFMVDQDVSVLNGEPTIRVNNPGGSTKGERHASQRLEPWLISARRLARRRQALQIKKVLDLRLYGRAWSEVLPEPKLWGLSRAKGESDESLVERAEELKRLNFPIVWRHVSARRTWPVFNDLGEVEEVISIRKVGAEVALDRWGYRAQRDQPVDVVYYTNHAWTAVLIPAADKRSEPELVHKWEHGMGMLPLVLFEAEPMPEDPDGQGVLWRSALFHAGDLIRVINDTFSDMRTVARKAVVAGIVITQNPELRQQYGWGTDKVEVKDNETINLMAGTSGIETAGQLLTAELNPTLINLIGLAKGMLDQIGLSRPALVGGILSGQSAVSLETAAQRAEAELRAAHESLESGAAEECVRFFRAVPALSKKFPSLPDAIRVIPPSEKFGRDEISVTPDDVKGYEHLIQAALTQNIPVDEGANVTNYSVAVKSGALSPESGRERYFRHGDPLGEQDKIDRSMIRQALIAAIAQVTAQRVVPVMDMGSQQGSLTTAAQGARPETTELAASMFEEDGQGELADLIRGQANKARGGRGQRMSRLTEAGFGG